ncbi:pentatricopeptide repeat-containing protein At5g57250, mitochondrial-like [Aristolochia californica]|uniref:pentatricopeptide repeat-containing protein At5g57250, mitochondrial-like n=1 Tax=Aristolochia californica TaxID=171875 RepID=UPI0035D8F376
MGMVLDVVVYSVVVDGLYKEGCLKEALDLCERMRAKGVHPNIVTYNSVISDLQDANELYKRMVLKGLIPNTCVYNSLINGNYNYGLIEQALDLVIHMEESGQIPDASTISFVLGGYSVKGDMETTLLFFGEC